MSFAELLRGVEAVALPAAEHAASEIPSSYRFRGLLGIGTWSWSNRVTRLSPRKVAHYCQAEPVYETARSLEVRLFDTAEIYSAGKSEEVLGACVRHDRRPERPVVATSFMPWPYLWSRSSLCKHLQGSLARLGLEKVELFQLHAPALSCRDIMTWMDELANCIDEGLIVHAGISNVGVENMEKACNALAKRGYQLASNQIEFSLLHNSAEHTGLLDACNELGVVPVAYSPLSLGVLKAGGLKLPFRRRIRVAQRETALEDMRLALIAVASSCSEKPSPCQVALSWVWSKNLIPLIGARTPEQVVTAYEASKIQLTPAQIELLDIVANSCRVQGSRLNRYRTYLQGV